MGAYSSLLSAGINQKNYYFGVDGSVGGRGAIFNNSNRNISYSFMLGFNLNTHRRITFRLAAGTDIPAANTKEIPGSPLLPSIYQSEIGIAYFLQKNK